MPRRMFSVSAAATFLVACQAFALPQAGKAPDTSPEAGALLVQARKAIADMHAMSYTASVEGAGALAGKLPAVKADVSATRADAGGWRLYTKGTSTTADAKAAFEVSYDGVIAFSNKEKDKVIFQKEPGNESELAVFFSGQGAKHPVAWEVIAEHPLDLNGGDAAMEPDATIGDVPCQVILMHPKPLEAGADAEAPQGVRFWLGKDDHLPRKIERLLGAPAGAAQSRVLTLTNLKLDSESSGAPYTMSIPDGYAIKSPDPKPEKKARPAPGQPQQAPGALAVGAAVPEFTLKDADGKDHSLKDYKGKIVLLDFWATWCPPCRAAMPGVQKIHEHFKGQPVVVIGVNTSENKDPVSYMKEKGFTYGLLLNGETIGDKYGIQGIPAFFLIGPDGKLLWTEVGYNPASEKEVTDLVTKTLKGMEK